MLLLWVGLRVMAHMAPLAVAEPDVEPQPAVLPSVDHAPPFSITTTSVASFPVPPVMANSGQKPTRPVARIARKLGLPMRAQTAAPPVAAVPMAPPVAMTNVVAPPIRIETQTALPVPARPHSLASPATRFTGSAWMQARGGGHSFGDFGQLGASQAGARLYYQAMQGISATGRISAPLRGRGKEASLGLAFKPGGMPFEILAERRFAIDKGGRSAFSLTIAAGVDQKRVAGGLRIDGYAQAGMVGARRHDTFADGAILVTRPIALPGLKDVGVGIGTWGGVQPGLSRLDIGPAIRLKTGHVSAQLGWRARVAGNAAPGSGPSLTIATGF